MKLGAVPTSLLEWFAKRFNLVPLPAVEALFGMLHSRFIMAGVRLGVFEALEAMPLPAAEIARRQHLDAEGTRLLCNALAAADYLHRGADGTFGLTAMARRYLITASRHYVGHYVEYNYDQWRWVEQLEEVVRTGHSLDLHQRLGEHTAGDSIGEWQSYLSGLADLAGESASEIARKVPIRRATASKPRTLLDIGGGDGTFSMALCARHRDLEAEIVDLPGGVSAGQALVNARAAASVRSRIRFRTADAMQDPLGAPDSFDAVIIFQLLHHLPPDAVPSLLARAVQVLKPGGWVSVIDLLEPEPGRRPNAATAYASLYFHLTSQGRGYTATEIRSWLRAAGCREIRERALLRVPGQPLISGRR